MRRGNVNKSIIMVLLIFTLLLFGCQNNSNHNRSNTWENKNNISIEDISGIEIQKKEATVRSLSQQDISVFMNAIHNGVYDDGKLDIRPSDYSVEIELKDGESKKLYLWIDDGGNLFTDKDENGHYKLMNESDRTDIKDILDV